MDINVTEIVSFIKNEIRQCQPPLDMEELGTVIEEGDGIAWIYGLKSAMAGEMVTFENGEMGQIFNLEEDKLGIVVLGDSSKIKEGHKVRLTGKLLSVPVGQNLIGRVVNPLGVPKDGGPEIEQIKYRPMEFKAPGIADRQPVFEALPTGIKAIDSMTPIGKGQRELIIGDRKTGKTAIAIDTIINQKNKDVICVYVAYYIFIFLFLFVFFFFFSSRRRHTR